MPDQADDTLTVQAVVRLLDRTAALWLAGLVVLFLVSVWGGVVLCAADFIVWSYACNRR